MEHHLPEPPAYISKVAQFNQAIFYCYNASSQRIPVGMMTDFVFKDDTTVLFTTKYFPVTEMSWNSFAAELHFYKKDITGSFILHGIAVLNNTQSGAVSFSIHTAEYAQDTGIAPEKISLAYLYKSYINLYRKSSELLLHPFKRKTTTGVFQ